MESGMLSITAEQFEVMFPNISLQTYIRTPMLRLGSQSNALVVFAMYAVVIAVGAACNAWVAAVIGRVFVRRVITGEGAITGGARGLLIYILALCCCDLLVLVCGLPLLVDVAYGQWVIPGLFVCRMHLAGECLNKFASPLLLTALSGFCYLQICRSKCFVARIGPWPIVISCLLLAAGLGLPLFMYSNVFYLVVVNGSSLRHVLPKCMFSVPEHQRPAFTMYSFAFAFLLPAVLFTYFYSAVLYHVYRHVRRVRASKTRYFWRAAKISLCLVIFYLACWMPYWILNLCVHFNAQVPLSVIMLYGFHLLPYLNCSGYPILYTVLNRNISENYSSACRRQRSRNQHRLLSRSVTKASIQAKSLSSWPRNGDECPPHDETVS